MKKNATCFRIIVLVREGTRPLHKLDSGDVLQIIRDLYEVNKSILSKIVKEFYGVVRKHLQQVFI